MCTPVVHCWRPGCCDVGGGLGSGAGQGGRSREPLRLRSTWSCSEAPPWCVWWGLLCVAPGNGRAIKDLKVLFHVRQCRISLSHKVPFRFDCDPGHTVSDDGSHATSTECEATSSDFILAWLLLPVRFDFASAGLSSFPTLAASCPVGREFIATPITASAASTLCTYGSQACLQTAPRTIPHGPLLYSSSSSQFCVFHGIGL